MDRDREFRPRFAPVKVGDELDVKIEAVGEKGDGVAKKDGSVLFVPNTKEGDEVRVRVTKVLRRVGFAEVVGGGSSESGESSGSEEAEDASEESEEQGEESSEESDDSEEKSEEADDSENFGEEEEK